MSKQLIRRGTFVVALVAAAALLWPAPTDAEGAWVINGGRDDNICNLFDPTGSIYSGGSTLVLTPSGRQLFSCYTSLVAGPGSDTTFSVRFEDPTVGDCTITVTRGRRANAHCHL